MSNGAGRVLSLLPASLSLAPFGLNRELTSEPTLSPQQEGDARAALLRARLPGTHAPRARPLVPHPTHGTAKPLAAAIPG